jgi:RNA polymerase sigma-70 factor, ECF subfamily
MLQAIREQNGWNRRCSNTRVREGASAPNIALEDTRGGGKDAEPLDRQRSEGLTDAALLARVTGGDRTALGDLYDRHATRAYSLASRLVGATLAADVVHDAFVALIEKPATFDPSLGSFHAWFMTAIHHRCLNLLRGNRPSVGEEVLIEVADPNPEPVEVLVQQLRDSSVREALEQLSADHREVLVLAYYGGLSQSAIAARLQLPLGTVKARMRRGLITLRGLLRGESIPDGEEMGP